MLLNQLTFLLDMDCVSIAPQSYFRLQVWGFLKWVCHLIVSFRYFCCMSWCSCAHGWHLRLCKHAQSWRFLSHRWSVEAHWAFGLLVNWWQHRFISHSVSFTQCKLTCLNLFTKHCLNIGLDSLINFLGICLIISICITIKCCYHLGLSRDLSSCYFHFLKVCLNAIFTGRHLIIVIIFVPKSLYEIKFQNLILFYDNFCLKKLFLQILKKSVFCLNIFCTLRHWFTRKRI